MTKVRIIGDVHIDKRFPFTSQKTAQVFRDLQAQIMEQVSVPNGPTFQLGDLFDGFSVSGETLVKGYRFASYKTLLAGNHDKSNNLDKSSALELLKEHMGLDIVWGSLREFHGDGTVFHLVPHQLTQELFEEALASLVHSKLGRNVLLLHCNFGNREGTQTENYLRPEVAKSLLSERGFDLIVSGHEHNFNKPMKGVVMLGSIMPYSFGEMTDKFVMDYDTQTGEYELIPTWVAVENYTCMSAGAAMPEPEAFTEIVGTTTVEMAAALNKQIAEWYKDGKVIAVKNSTTLLRHEREVQEYKAEDWVAEVMKQCNDAQQGKLKELLLS